MFRALQFLLISLAAVNSQNFSDNNSLFESSELQLRKVTNEIKVKTKVANFRNPAVNPRSSPTHSMKLQLINQNICQIRVDINSLYLQDPLPSADTSALFSVSCNEDRFTVDFTNQDVRLPELCGTTKNTHFYVQLGQNKNVKVKSVTFTVSLGPDGLYPAWDIQATQLECPGKNNDPQNYEDFDKLAPPDCLQYFTAPTGSFHSFGWNSNSMSSSLTTNQDYSICFKRVPNSCGIRFTTNFFGLWDTLDLPIGGPVICRNSYIYTPETRTTPITHDDEEKRCPDMFTANPTAISWSSEHPGPLYIHFHVDSQVMSTFASALNPIEAIRRGFDIKYNSLIGCTPIQLPPP